MGEEEKGKITEGGKVQFKHVNYTMSTVQPPIRDPPR